MGIINKEDKSRRIYISLGGIQKLQPSIELLWRVVSGNRLLDDTIDFGTMAHKA